jgi:hypothetical protein
MAHKASRSVVLTLHLQEGSVPGAVYKTGVDPAYSAVYKGGHKSTYQEEYEPTEHVPERLHFYDQLMQNPYGAGAHTATAALGPAGLGWLG